jgi:hypothetical protein
VGLRSGVLLFAVFALLTAAGAAATPRLPIYEFSTPSRNILCEAVWPKWRAAEGEITCWLLSSFNAEDNPLAGYLQVRGRGAIGPSDNAGNPDAETKNPIPYGHTWHAGFLSCASRRTGLTCTSTLTKHGFFLSRESQRAW